MIKTDQKGYVRLVTSMGDINLELHCDLVPKTCEVCTRVRFFFFFFLIRVAEQCDGDCRRTSSRSPSASSTTARRFIDSSKTLWFKAGNHYLISRKCGESLIDYVHICLAIRRAPGVAACRRSGSRSNRKRRFCDTFASE